MKKKNVYTQQDSTSAKKAIDNLHRYNYRGRELVVKEDLDCERDRFGRLILPSSKRDKERDRDARERDSIYDRQGYVSASQMNYNTYGLSPQFLESLGVSGPLNNRIFVANLDFKVGEKKLEEIFRLAGKVLRVRLYTDSSNNSKGHGTVEFEHPVEAVQAISMFHNQKLYGRPMSIRMDKYETEETPEVLPSKLPSGLEGVGKGLGIGGQPLNISKSLLTQPVSQVAPVQPPQQPLPPPNTALNAFGNLAGSLNPQVSTLAQTGLTSQLPPTSAVSASPALGSSSIGIPGFADRSIQNLGAPQSLTGLAGTPVSGLNNLATTAQSVLASLSGTSSLTANLNPGQLGLAAPTPQPVTPNPSNLSVYSTYEREFRDEKYRVPPPQSISDTIVVRNLPPGFSWQNLRDRFNEIGEVRYTELKARGTAIVRFHSERDAQRAVELMNGIRVDNRPIEVGFY